MIKPDKEQVFAINNKAVFEETALQIFRYQAANCTVYKSLLAGIRVNAADVKYVEQIPFLPVELFKSHIRITTSDTPAGVVFTSSGTTGMITSSHHVTDVSWYVESFRKAFGLFYGDMKNYTVLALLPSYLEREGSSLIYMAQDLITQSANLQVASSCIITRNFTIPYYNKKQPANQPC
jgi:phenylacetate-coenzyme A ligase PaaK-like adenylate-forming protein